MVLNVCEMRKTMKLAMEIVLYLFEKKTILRTSLTFGNFFRRLNTQILHNIGFNVCTLNLCQMCKTRLQVSIRKIR